MKNFQPVILSLCAILAYCCQSGVKTPSKLTVADSKVIGHEEEEKADLKKRSQALAVLDHRIKNDPETYAIIEAGVLNYLFVFNGSKISKSEDYVGDWINFKDDFTYEYGNFDTVQGEGRYHYSMDKSQLVMVDNNEKLNPQEWDIKSGGDVIIMIGSKTYGNNAFQIKLERQPDRPTK